MNMLNRRNWILSPLLSVVFVLAVYIFAAQAAILKDIRVGEYDSFTRIVFELDSSAEPGKIVPISSDQIAMIFADTSVELIRKIPVERSRHIKQIQIWDKKDQLSAVLQFDFDHFKHQSFSLANPPRIVLDVMPLGKTPDAAAAVAPAARNGSQGESPQLEETKASEPFPMQVQGTGRALAGTEVNKSPSFKIPQEIQRPPTPPLTAAVKNPGVTTDERPVMSPASPPKSAARPSRLQFYLVVALVLITIIILALLLLMLLSKHRWVEDKSRLSAKEFLQNQEKRIASLDARIQEQLKRYEEAQ